MIDLANCEIETLREDGEFAVARAKKLNGLSSWLVVSARGFETITDAYLRNARYCYLRWGADGKVRQLDRLYPHLAAPEGRRPVSLNATIGTPVGQLDAETVARTSQAISSEIVLPRLIERLMRIVVEHAGAERASFCFTLPSHPAQEPLISPLTI
jgi:hypothetical protein